jgi:hypothetical protein
MLTPRQVLDTYYLEARRDLLEIAALIDRYDAAVAREGRTAEDESKLLVLRRALALLADPAPADERASALLELFAEI